MKTLLAGFLVLTTTAVAQVTPPPVPSLKEALKRPNTQVIIFQPASIARGQTLRVTHVRVGDGSVKPGAGAQLIVYSSGADMSGEHAVLLQDSRFFSKEGSPVSHFAPFTFPADQVGEPERLGIIAVLIGLSQASPNSPARPGPLPPQDIVAAEITDGTSIGLLLPAVQKVRSAAAR